MEIGRRGDGWVGGETGWLVGRDVCVHIFFSVLKG